MITGHKPSAGCIPYPGSPTQLPLASVPVCLDCTEAKGKRFLPTCITCASTPDPTSCTSCIQSYYPRLVCRNKEYKDCYRPEYDNPCATCQTHSKSKAGLAKCLTCYSNPQQRQDCDACGGLAGAQDQEQCYSCASALKNSSSDQEGGCGTCFATTRGPARQQCLQCVLNPSTPMAARRLCATCSDPKLSDDQRQRCFACVTAPGAGPACQQCSAATATAAGFQQCLRCYRNKGSSMDCEDCLNAVPTAEVTPPGSRRAAAGNSSRVAYGMMADLAKARCFQCVVNSKLQVFPGAPLAPLSSCRSCYDPKNNLAACLSCNQDPKVPTAAKSWCAGCSGLGTPAKRAACLQCLRTKRVDSGDYGTACGLSKRLL